MNVLITGATSNLGSHLTKKFLNAGDSVFAIVRPSSLNMSALPCDSRNLTVLRYNLNDELPVSDLPQMDILVHLAWAAPGVSGRMNPELQRENYDNTISVIKTAAKLGCKAVVFTGSQAEYGINAERIKSGFVPDRPVSETDECFPISFYAKEKLHVLCDVPSIAALHKMNYVHLRIFSVYGPGEHSTTLVSSCLNAALNGVSVDLGLCEQLWNYLYIDDCIEAIYSASVMAQNKPFLTAEPIILNIAGEETHPLRYFVDTLFSVCNSGSYTLNVRKAGPEGTQWLNPSTEKMTTLTGWRAAHSFSDGITEYLSIIKARKS